MSQRDYPQLDKREMAIVELGREIKRVCEALEKIASLKPANSIAARAMGFDYCQEIAREALAVTSRTPEGTP